MAIFHPPRESASPSTRDLARPGRLRSAIAAFRAASASVITLAALASAACASDSARVAVVIADTRAEAKDADTLADVRAACAVWGLDCEPGLDQRGAVVVTLTTSPAKVVGAPAGRGISGQATWRPCQPRLWSIGDRYVLAHELGHALGLKHHNDPANVMHAIPGTDVTAAQTRRALLHARALDLCPGHDPILD